MSSLSSLPPSSGIGNALYEDAAAIGRFRTFIGLIIASIIGLILFIFGAYRIMYGKKYEEIPAVITKVGSCQTTTTTTTSHNTTTSTPLTTCLVDVKYTFNNVEHTSTVTMTQDINNLFAVGQTVTVYIDPASPGSAHASPDLSGWIFIALALLAVGIGYFSYWLSERYKFFAAAEGAGLAVNVTRGMW